MTTRLTLLCHAATAATRAAHFAGDEAVDDKAAAQLAACAGRLPRADRALSSRSCCARQTAAALGLAAEPIVELDDCDFGRWRGRTLAEIAAAEPEGLSSWLSDPTAAPHGGESIATLIERVANWLDSVRDASRIVAVTHPAVVRAATLHVLGAPAESFWRIDAGPLAVIDLRHDGRRWALRAVTLDALS
jgi:broad specificity phosphatase PhoE